MRTNKPHKTSMLREVIGALIGGGSGIASILGHVIFTEGDYIFFGEVESNLFL